MKKLLVLCVILSGISVAVTSQECGKNLVLGTHQPTSIGIVIYSNDAETVWNALRLANYSQTLGDTVTVFLLGKGVEMEKIKDSKFDVNDQVLSFKSKGGMFLACETCMKQRGTKESNMCYISSIKELYEIIRTRKIVLTF